MRLLRVGGSREGERGGSWLSGCVSRLIGQRQRASARKSMQITLNY